MFHFIPERVKKLEETSGKMFNILYVSFDIGNLLLKVDIFYYKTI